MKLKYHQVKFRLEKTEKKYENPNHVWNLIGITFLPLSFAREDGNYSTLFTSYFDHAQRKCWKNWGPKYWGKKWAQNCRPWKYKFQFQIKRVSFPSLLSHMLPALFTRIHFLRLFFFWFYFAPHKKLNAMKISFGRCGYRAANAKRTNGKKNFKHDNYMSIRITSRE